MVDVDRRSLRTRILSLGMKPEKIRLVDPKDGFTSKPKKKVREVGAQQPRPVDSMPVRSAQKNLAPTYSPTQRNGEPSNAKVTLDVSTIVTFFCSIVLAALFALGSALKEGFKHLCVFEDVPPIYMDRILIIAGFEPLEKKLVPFSLEGGWFSVFQVASGIGSLLFLMFGVFLLVSLRREGVIARFVR